MATEDKTAPALVTGASGFIATHVIKELIKQGYKVRGTVRSLENEIKVKPVLELGTAENPIDLYEANLTDESSWIPAVQGCQYVFHIASPIQSGTPTHEDEMIKPAVNGVLSILKACRDDGGVKRVILTSSIAAVNSGFIAREKAWTEEDWTNPDNLSGPTDAYVKSKTLAEKAAWDFVKELPIDKKFELAVINPGVVLGPPLCGFLSASMELPKKLLHREILAIPKLGLAIVDVRDVALAHVNAMTLPEAAGNRHILVTKSLWIKEIAMILKEEFAPQGYNVPTTEMPNFLVRIASWFDSTLRFVTPALGQLPQFDSSRMKNVLGIKGTETNVSILDMAYKMIEGGHIKKTENYTSPKHFE